MRPVGAVAAFLALVLATPASAGNRAPRAPQRVQCRRRRELQFGPLRPKLTRRLRRHRRLHRPEACRRWAGRWLVLQLRPRRLRLRPRLPTRLCHWPRRCLAGRSEIHLQIRQSRFERRHDLDPAVGRLHHDGRARADHSLQRLRAGRLVADHAQASVRANAHHRPHLRRCHPVRRRRPALFDIKSKIIDAVGFALIDAHTVDVTGAP